MATSKFGQHGEDIAVKLLENKGYKIIKRNFKCKLGEIDIIALDNDTLVFVEVKSRRGTKFGVPEEAVNKRKLNKIVKISQFYLLKYKNLPKKQRIDVVSLIFDNFELVSSKIIKAI